MQQNERIKKIVSRRFPNILEEARLLDRRHPVPVKIFLAMCLDLVIAPTVYAASGDEVSRKVAWSLGCLLLLTGGLSIYLFWVIFEPERF